MDSAIHNGRVALRSLRRTPGFALTAVLTLAMGIGLSTAVFTVVEALLIRELPVREQDRLVVLWGQSADRAFDHWPLGFASAQEFGRRTRTLERVAFVGYEGAWPQPIRDEGGMSRLRQAVVSGEFFEVLGVQPVLGRVLRPEDDVVGAAPVVVLSHGAWQRHFGGSADAVGRRIVVHGNGVAYTIVGVTPQGLDYPRGTDFWVPVVPTRTTPGTDGPFADVDLIGRLRPSSTASMAREELTTFFGRPEVSAWSRNLRGVVHALPRLLLGDVKPAVIAFTAAVGLLLLITCINVANLLLVRGLARVREVALRSALGAGRGRVILQLLTENSILALAGGVLGLLVAAGAVQTFVAFAPAGVPRLDEIQVDLTALAGAFAITGFAMFLFGLAPAIMTSRVDLQQVLRSGTHQSAGRGSRLATEGLVAAQIALAVLVLSAAGLIARSLIKLERADLSFEGSQLLIAELAIRYDQFDNRQKQLALLDRLVPAIEAIPGVGAVSPVVAVPFSGPGGWDGRPGAEGQSPEEAAAGPLLNLDVVSPDYFATLGIPLLRGRGFTAEDRDGAPSVIVISQSTARHYWPGADPIGNRLTMGPTVGRSLTVVGVVPDTRYRDLRDPRPSIYFPIQQSFFPFAPDRLVIRTTGRPGAVVPALRHAIDALDPSIALADATPFETFLDRPLAQPRLNALLLALFALAAVALAAVGLFGVMATMVGRRTREIGVRMALGATAGEVRSLVMRRGLAIAAAGMAVGLVGALGANRLLTALLYEVSPTDTLTLALVALLLLGVAIGATFVPARASSRIDPAIALRAEG